MNQNNNSGTCTKPAAGSTTLEIDGMNGDACVQKVTGALKGVQGMTSPSVKVGSATFACNDPSKAKAAIDAIKTAGYEARETTDQNGASDPVGRGTPVHTAGAKDQAVDTNGGATRKGDGSNANRPVTITEKVASPVGASSNN